MRTRALGIAVVLAAALTLACGKTKREDAILPVAEAPRGPLCPLSVDRAASQVTGVEGGVALLVTARDPAAVDEIRGRARAIVVRVGDLPLTQAHSGRGEGAAGLLGRCPVVLRHTTVTSEPVPDGARIVVRTSLNDPIAWLRRETRERLSELALPGAEGPARSHCPTTLPGVETTITPTADETRIVVTSKAPDVVRAIRARAWHVAEVSARRPAGVKGPPRGGLDRGDACPVIFGDNVVEWREIEGGAEIHLRPRAPVTAERR